MKKLKLTDRQKEVIEGMRAGKFVIGSAVIGFWWGGGSGGSVSGATLNALQKKGLIDRHQGYQLTELGKTVEIAE